MIEKLFGSIAQAVDTGHPFWLALLGILLGLICLTAISVYIGVSMLQPAEHDED